MSGSLDPPLNIGKAPIIDPKKIPTIASDNDNLLPKEGKGGNTISCPAPDGPFGRAGVQPDLDKKEDIAPPIQNIINNAKENEAKDHVGSGFRARAPDDAEGDKDEKMGIDDNQPPPPKRPLRDMHAIHDHDHIEPIINAQFGLIPVNGNGSGSGNGMSSNDMQNIKDIIAKAMAPRVRTSRGKWFYPPSTRNTTQMGLVMTSSNNAKLSQQKRQSLLG
jgi:hypothetical protein